jgi:molecular chaperone GrpE
MAEPELKGRQDEPTAATSEAESSPEALLESLRRERASFLNYKRRVDQERAADRERAEGEVVLRLLPLLDELDRALAQRPADLATHPWAEGVAILHRRLLEALRQLGVERIGAEGEPFDPAHHEALFYDGRPDADDTRVAEVIRPGYRLGNRLLRPAQVGVAGPAQAPLGPAPAAAGHPWRASRSPEPDARVGG